MMKLTKTIKVIVNNEEYTFTEDMRYGRMAELAKTSTSGTFLYSLALACEKITKEEITTVLDTKDGEHKYINIPNFMKYWDKGRKELEKSNVRSSAKTAYYAMLDVITLAEEVVGDVTPELTELELIQKQLDALKDKFTQKGNIAELKKTIKDLKDQLELSESKAEELRKVNLDLVNKNDKLRKESVELRELKAKLSGIIK